MRAIIVGGGIGGLCAALCLQRIGWQVRVLEQAAQLGAVGAGIQISPNASRVLAQLELLPALTAVAFAPQALEMRWGRSGRSIFHLPLDDRRWGMPYLHLHREDLIRVLAEALEQRAAGALQLNSPVRECQQCDDRVEVLTDDGQRHEAELLIAADGVHSGLRQQLFGEQAARFTGHVAWRAVVPMQQLGDLAPPPSACVWTGPGRHAVTYRLRRGELANFVGVVEQQAWSGESWSQRGERQQALADFAGWHPTLLRMIDKAPDHFRWALLAREPLTHWHRGRIVLLGDSAHPMLPFMAQGAAMAIEDAWALGLALQQHCDPAVAATAYVEARRHRCNRVQAASQANSRRFHQPDLAYWPLWLLARLMPGLLLKPFDWIYRDAS